MSSSSSTSDNSDLDALTTFSPYELSRMTTEPLMLNPLNDAFPPRSPNTVALRYYAFMSHSIAALEREIERIHIERQLMYDHMMVNGLFRRRIAPILREYRLLTGQQNRRRYHPYGHTPSPIPTPSRQGSEQPPSSIEILPAEALARIMTPPNASSIDVQQVEHPSRPSTHSPTSSLDSFKTAIDDAPGTRENPIIISDDEDERCLRCDQPGHSRSNCETLIDDTLRSGPSHQP
jgi:hypothetical protein